MALKFSNGAMVCASLLHSLGALSEAVRHTSSGTGGLVVRFICVAAGAFSFPMLAGLPSEMTAPLVRQAAYNVFASMAFTSVWLLY